MKTYLVLPVISGTSVTEWRVVRGDVVRGDVVWDKVFASYRDACEEINKDPGMFEVQICACFK